VKTNAGTYYIWYKQDAATGYNAKAASYVGSVTISQKEVGLTWGDTEFVYDGTNQAPTATATELVGNDTCTVTVTGGQTNAGDHIATASSLSNSNYKLPASNTQNFSILKKDATVTANDQSVVLNGSVTQDASKATLTGAVEGHTLTSVTLTGSSTGSVTTEGTITPSAAIIKSGNTDVTSNYNITYVDGTLTVTKGAPVVTAPAANNLTYNGQEQVLTTAGSSEHGTITYSTTENGTYSRTIPKGKNAGDYEVWWKLTGDSDHSDIPPTKVVVTINKKPVKVSGITAQDKTYDGTTDAEFDTSDATFAGIENGDTLTVTAVGAFDDVKLSILLYTFLTPNSLSNHIHL